jgi:hypothetical protein
MAESMKHKKQIKIFIRVLWGESILGDFEKNFDRITRFAVGRSFFNDVRSSVWPLHQDLTVLERENGATYLNADIPWNGIIIHNNNTSIIDARRRGRKNLLLKPGCFASIKYESISIAIRVGGDLQTEQVRDVSAKYRGPFMGLIADTNHEQKSLGLGLIASALLIGAVALGLKKAPTWRPESMAEIKQDFRLPFISPHHFASGPNIIQDKLDRFEFVDSVASFYRDLTYTLTDATSTDEKSMIAESTRLAYQEYFRDQGFELARRDAVSEKLTSDIKSNGALVLALPAVRGESLDAKALRVLDKISIVAENAQALIDMRITTAESFKKDPGYDYATGESNSGLDSMAEFTKALGAGYRGVPPDEEHQAMQAKDLSAKATALQVALFGADHLAVGPQSCCTPPVGLKAGVTPASYTPMPRFALSDQNIEELKTSTWGTPAPASENKISSIREPIAGIIDETALEKAIASGRFQLKLCFELALRRNQAATGTMEWQWRIDTRGEISALALTKSTLKDDELVHCVRSRIAKWKLPKPKGGSVEVRYPFEFVRDKG